MGRNKLYERKVSGISRRIKLFEITNNYVKLRAKNEGKSEAEIIRELCEYARLEELTKGQFSHGTTKIFRSVQDKLLKQNVVDPVENLTEEIRILQKKISEMEVNERFMQEEVYKVLRAFFVENQVLVNELTNQYDLKQETIKTERKKIRETIIEDFNTRKDTFYVKYQLLQKVLDSEQNGGINILKEKEKSD